MLLFSAESYNSTKTDKLERTYTRMFQVTLNVSWKTIEKKQIEININL